VKSKIKRGEEISLGLNLPQVKRRPGPATCGNSRSIVARRKALNTLKPPATGASTRAKSKSKRGREIVCVIVSARECASVYYHEKIKEMTPAIAHSVDH